MIQISHHLVLLLKEIYVHAAWTGQGGGAEMGDGEGDVVPQALARHAGGKDINRARETDKITYLGGVDRWSRWQMA